MTCEVGREFGEIWCDDGNVEGGSLDLDIRYLEIIRVGYLCANSR